MDVQRLKSEDLQGREEVLNMMIKAFAKEDFLTQFLDGNDHTMRLAHLMKIDGALDVGEVWYIRDGGDVTSVCICSPPGVTLRDSESWKALAAEYDSNLPPAAREWEAAALGGPTKLRNERAPEVTRATWYIHAIGTLPEFQGRGQAKAILRHIEARAKAHRGKMALLAISKPNVERVYKPAGFYPIVDEVFKLRDGTERPYCFMLHDCT